MNRTLFKILSILEDTTAFLLCLGLFIYYIGYPSEGYTLRCIILKLLALLVIYIIAKFEEE